MTRPSASDSLPFAAASSSASNALVRSAFAIGDGGAIQVGGAATDRQGNVYVAGGYWGTVTFSSSPAVTFTSSADADFYVAKISPTGVPLWVRVAAGARGLPAGRALEGALALDVDDSGNVYVGGGFLARLALLTASGGVAVELTGKPSNFEAFVARYDTNGELRWARGGNSGANVTTGLGDGVNAITQLVVDRSGKPYVAGRFSGVRFLGSETDIEPSEASAVAKLDPATGEFEWLSLTGGDGGDGVYSMAVDERGDLYTVGYTEGETEFFAETGAITIQLPADIAWATYIAKYDADGDAVWARTVGDPSDEILTNDVEVGPRGELYVAGGFFGDADLGPTQLRAPDEVMWGFVARLDATGEPLWARGFGGDDTSASRVAVSRSGRVHVAGWFSQRATFRDDGAAAPVAITSESVVDTFLASFDADGKLVAAHAQNGTGTSGFDLISSDDVPIVTNPISLVEDRASGDILFVSDFNGALTLAPGVSLNAPAEGRRLFVARVEASSRHRGVRRP